MSRIPGLSLLVFCSGAAALIYEVVWARQLATFLGITAYAHAAVLSAFMLGLAIGSWALGRWSDQWRRPLALFGALEIAVGIYGAASGWILGRLQILYANWSGRLGVEGLLSGASSEDFSSFEPIGIGVAGYSLRFAVAIAALLPPAVLMGGTLPALLRGLAAIASGSSSTQPSPGTGPALEAQILGKLYGVNTLGAATGALATGYVLLGTLGVRGTTMAAAAINLIVGALALMLDRRIVHRRRLESTVDRRVQTPEPATETCSDDPRGGHPRRPLWIAFALSGLLALAVQILWTRALTLVIGSSIYAFSLVLGTYLLGTGLGSLLVQRRLGQQNHARLLLSSSRFEALLAFSLVLGLPILSLLPRVFVSAYRSGATESFPLLQLLLFALCGAVILIPTAVQGALYPMVTLLLLPDPEGDSTHERLGRRIGQAFAANSLGTFIGAPVAAIWLLPTLGVARSLVVVGAGHLILAFFFRHLVSTRTSTCRRVDRGRAIQGVAIVAIYLGLALLGPWSPELMTAGPYVNAFRLAEAPDNRNFLDWLKERNQLLYYREGADATVSVRQDGDERLLVINGKTDGSRFGDRRTQAALGHLPMLIHPAPRRALVIGLGTGITAAAAGLHPDLEHLDIVEMSPGVVAASAFFDDDNRGILFDPRVRLIQADARSLLLVQAAAADRDRAAEPLYDVLISEPSNPWISGISNLFTREFFQLAASRLAPRGIYAQWFHGYGMSNRDLRTVLGTFRSVLPHVTVWLPDGGDLVFIGSRQPHQLLLQRLERVLQEPAAEADLGPARLADLSDFASMFLLGSEHVATYVRGASVNTDDLPRVELSAPRHLYSETTLSNLVDMLRFRGNQALELPVQGLVEVQSERNSIQAFGVEVSTTADTLPASNASWKVRWQPVAASDPSLEPKLLVSQERSLSVPGDPGIEVLVLSDTASTSADTGDRSWLAPLLGGSIISHGHIQLADGTDASWVVAGAARDAPRLALGFACPRQACLAKTPFRYAVLQTLPEPSATETTLAGLAQALRCLPLQR